MKPERHLYKILLVVILCTVSGCVGLPDNSKRPQAVALPAKPTTKLARIVEPLFHGRRGVSGFHMLDSGQEAFAARLILTDQAQHSLDLQYFIWKRDLTGKIIVERLLRAADRGVKVRLLIDDLGAVPSDRDLIALDSHANIEVRLFNPVALRSLKTLGMLLEASRINRRMHNKSFIADGQVAIVGGRNIGDEYFGASEMMNFADLDLAAIGPVVKELGNAFDLYWNSSASYRIWDLTKLKHSQAELDKVRAEMATHDSINKVSAYAESLRTSEFARKWSHGGVHFDFGRAWVLFDQPDKILHPAERAVSQLAPRLSEERAKTRHELFLVSPYFVPGSRGVDRLAAIRKRGARVVLVTNSLASTDGVLVHSGYKGYREALLRAGVEVYEVKPTVGIRRPRLAWRSARIWRSRAIWNARSSAAASMHTKTFTFDRQRLFCGSYNLDPRSKYLNTEIGILVDCPRLAGVIPREVERILPHEAWRLELDGGRLSWVSLEEGHTVRFTNEPHAGLWKRLKASVLSWFPLEGQL